VDANGPREGWLHRHRALVTGVTVAVALVAAGAWAFERESGENARKLDEAQARADRAEKAQVAATNASREAAMKHAKRAEQNFDRAEKAEKEARANEERAEANLKLARKAVDEYVTLANEHPLLQKPEAAQIKKLLLEKAKAFDKNLREPRPDDK
jgi:FtsZ-interacting cell division protein ZipA